MRPLLEERKHNLTKRLLSRPSAAESLLPKVQIRRGLAAGGANDAVECDANLRGAVRVQCHDRWWW